ncbi:MAG: hypothetical protein IT443_13490 [Phycisphaeraceae bacterium]|nr:hypothetical protein [Phycisphaeraceae bacterium]
MKKNVRNLFAIVSLLGVIALALPAQAGTVYQVDKANSSVSAHNSGDGLLINTSIIVPNGYSFVLNNVGDTHTFNFFKIWTTEDWVNDGEDTVAKPIFATLAFSQPLSSGTVNGDTVGVTVGMGGFYQAGKVTWNGPVYVDTASGKYKITLSDEVFNEGKFWTGPGKGKGIVEATIEQITIIPLPAAVWGGMALLSMLGAGKIIRRRD